ncbi:Maf1 regulator-domain-containing protein [Radiomyces spectabilis]|uniref:Maf1 regulator-domain-containing protein n=1 Tax=Radiomyces spectabilis TaxID=64574 RepID=UPI0022212669|nr:Maf1 regulator-domain-containing protein [Radiomyces spectabilis]KAI8370439.1 Maf1 regulator-domain-containing protein [Radiomyces spectabilis]
MKFLEIDSLDVLNTAFRWETPEAILTGRIEAYSCKSAGSDKKLFKQLESKYSVDLTIGSISPDDPMQHLISPFGRLDETTPRKTFFYLLATLNASFPEHDFSDVRPDQFNKQPSVELVINSVNTTLFNLGNDVIVNRYRMWDILDELVELNDCDVYSYNPDSDDDPMNEEDGFLWSMNYFFFNRKLKRMVFFSVKSQSMNAPGDDEDLDGFDSEDDDEDLTSRRPHHHDAFIMGDMEV